METAGRSKGFDIARGIGIILVILGHIEYISDFQRIAIVTYHMPMFFLLSGMLMNITGEAGRPFASLVKRKAGRMMLPFFLYSLIDTAASVIYTGATGGDAMAAVPDYIARTLTLNGISVLWFLPALLGSQLIFLIMVKRFKGAVCILLSLVFASAVPWAYSRSVDICASIGPSLASIYLGYLSVTILRMFFGTVFIMTGFYIQEYRKWRRMSRESVKRLSPGLVHRVETRRERIMRKLGGGAFLLLVSLCCGLINGVTDMHFLVFGSNLALYMAGAVSGSLGTLNVAEGIEAIGIKWLTGSLAYYGRNSLVVMATHIELYVLYLSEIIAVRLYPLLPLSLRTRVFVAATLLLVLIFEIVIIEVVNRFLPVLAGKGPARISGARGSGGGGSAGRIKNSG